MPKIDVYTTTGQKSARIDLPKEIFAAKINKPLMAQAVRVYLSNQRTAKAKTKTRGEICGSRRKIWRQKGTGRARHGDRYAPIFVGGGRAHGPIGNQNYSLKLTKKMRRLALFSALTSKLKDDEIILVRNLGQTESKTKNMAGVLNKLGKSGKWTAGNQKLTIILPEIMDSLIRAARNIEKVKLAQAGLLNTFEVLNGGKLILMEESIGVMKDRFLNKKPKTVKKAEKKVVNKG